jgi:hypothetical protein
VHDPPPQPQPPGHALPPYAPNPQLPPQYPNPPYPVQPSAYGYYAPVYAPAVRGPQTSSFAIASLVISIVSWFIVPFIGGIVAVILGHTALSEIRRSNGAIGGGGMARAGLILGYVQIAAMILLIALIIWFAVIFAQHPVV